MKKRLGLVVLLVSALFVGCSSDTDDKKEDIDEVAAVSATINGKEWKATKIKKVVLVQNIPNVGVQLLNLYFNDDSQALSLICESSFSSNDTMPLKEYFYNDTDTNAWFLNYYLIDGVGYVRHSQKYGKITITAMNPEKKKQSLEPLVLELKKKMFTRLKLLLRMFLKLQMEFLLICLIALLKVNKGIFYLFKPDRFLKPVGFVLLNYKSKNRSKESKFSF